MILDTIVAPATAQGVGAIAVIRLSGTETFAITDKICSKNNISSNASHTLHFTEILDNEGSVIDEVVVSLFKAPRSFTKEDVVEISCHGSPYIIQKIISLCLFHGARLARAGEFTQRAFLNGRFNLAQAEAVADLIHAETESSHKTALHQMRSGFAIQLKELRSELVNLTSLLELELDFSEEDVAFADRTQLMKLCVRIYETIAPLTESFETGNAIKTGIPIVIAGKPNAGKSTLLNALLNEDKAIVSEIAGTTRDLIEDTMIIKGINFRFIDTAGIRTTDDIVEKIGVERSLLKISQATIIVYLFDISNTTKEELELELTKLSKSDAKILLVGNKLDKELQKESITSLEILPISAKNKLGIQELKDKIYQQSTQHLAFQNQDIVTNIRHFNSLTECTSYIKTIIEGININQTSDILAEDLRSAIYHLGEITGEVTNDEVLGNIFSKFCIGK